jgi:hypothetical protein
MVYNIESQSPGIQGQQTLKPGGNMNKRVQIYLDVELLAALDSEAKEHGISRSEIIRKRLMHSYQNDVVYIDYVNSQLELAQEQDENE